MFSLAASVAALTSGSERCGKNVVAALLMRCRSCVGQLDAIGVRVSDEVGINTEDFSLLASIGGLFLPKSLSFGTWQD